MNDFDYEVKQRKALARNAIHRKSGSKSKKCSLPSDHMTKAEWKRRNGKVESYSLNKPMTYAEWKSLPDDLEREYYDTLREKYNVNKSAFQSMLGCARTTMLHELDRLGYEKEGFGTAGKQAKMSGKEMEEWGKFLYIRYPEQKKAQEQERKTEPTPEPKAEEKRDEKLAEIPKPRLDSLSFVINGANKQIELSIQDWLAMLPIGTYSVSIQITRNNHGT